MINKGNKIERWNWQAQDKQDGIYPSDELSTDENHNNLNRLDAGEAIIYDPSS